MYRLDFHNTRPSFVGRANLTVIGRDADCALRLTEAGVGDRHAEIERRADGLYIRDLGTAIGVRVNGQRITEQRLANGDEIEFGAVRAAFEILHEPPPQRRAFDPLQALAFAVVACLVVGQIGLFVWILSQEHPRRARTDILKGSRQQAQESKAPVEDAPRVLAPLPATSAPAAPPSEVLNRMIRIVRVEKAGATLRIQLKAQVGERTLDPVAIGVSVQCAGTALWVPVPSDWDNFSSRTLTARLTGPCDNFTVSTYYRKTLQDQWVGR